MNRIQPTMLRWVAVVGSFVIAGFSTFAGLAASWRDRLPAQVASHWGGSGVDDTQSLDAFIATAGAAVAGTTLLLGLVARFAPAAIRRVLGATQAGMGLYLTTAFAGSLYDQVGLTDPYAAPAPGGWLGVGIVPGALAAYLAWRLLPAQEIAVTITDPLPTGVTTLATRPGEQLSWVGRVPLSAAPYVLLGLTSAVGVFIAWQAGTPWAGVLPAVVGAVVVWMCRATVLVDRAGLRVRSAGRVTWLRIPLDRIRQAQADQVRPLAEFGGWGLRWGVRGRGFVTRTGPALRVDAADGSSTWVSVDDAEQAAATLNTLTAAQRHS